MGAMDRFIAKFPSENDGDLEICKAGVAYQRDMTAPIEYNGAYFDHYKALEGSEIAKKINTGRIKLVNDNAGWQRPVLDIGIGSGEFIKRRPNTYGYDINPTAQAWLKENELWRDDLSQFRAFSMWDVIEHVRCPSDYLDWMPKGSWLFLSIPVFHDLSRVRQSKHYKPNEHFYYFTPRGLIDWLSLYGFRLVERSKFESQWRDKIESFALQRE